VFVLHFQYIIKTKGETVKKILLLSLILFGCATKPTKLAPLVTSNRLQILKKHLENPKSQNENLKLTPGSESESMAYDYLKANQLLSIDKKKACIQFKNLSEMNNFPLKDVALLKTLQSCDLSHRELRKIWDSFKAPKYLNEEYLKTSIALAHKEKLLNEEAKLNLEYLQFIPTQAAKVSLLKDSIELAKEDGDQDLLSSLNQKLIIVSPQYNEKITNENIYQVAKDFESSRNFNRARELYNQIINGEFSLEEKIKAFNSLRTSFKVARDLKTFIEKTNEMDQYFKKLSDENSNDPKFTEAWSETRILYARAIWTDHRNDEAKKLLLELLDSKLGSNNQRANIFYILGSIELEQKNSDAALDYYNEAIKFKITDNALLENIQWAIVWNNYLLKKNKNVIELATGFIKNTNNQNFSNKLLYWKSKALIKLKKKEDALFGFETLMTQDNFGYYGILASMELGRGLSPLKSEVVQVEPTGIVLFDWLMAMNEKTFAQNYLKEIDNTFKTYKDREKAMDYYKMADWFQGGMRQIYNLQPKKRNEVIEKNINLIFPTPYFDLVVSNSKKYTVPTELIYGIIRQESAFVASERSWADAFGLMQLTPEKAKELSKKYHLNYQDFNDLYKPEVNIEMGTLILKEHIKDYKGKFAQTVAAYNASPEAIKRWEKDRFAGNYFEFIEQIPYEETRNYIKLVFRNFITYKRVLSSKDVFVNQHFFSEAF
jgi:soluble lytic murein transglycosylase